MGARPRQGIRLLLIQYFQRPRSCDARPGPPICETCDDTQLASSQPKVPHDARQPELIDLRRRDRPTLASLLQPRDQRGSFFAGPLGALAGTPWMWTLA